MALQAPPSEKSWADATVYVTPRAQSQLSASEIWYHLGGWNEDGDTYETQEYAFFRGTRALLGDPGRTR